MKRILAACLLGLLAAGGFAWSQAPQSMSATEKAVAALENQWLQSQKTNDPGLVAPLLAEKIVSTGPDGQVMNKTQMLADAKTRKYTSAEYENVQVSAFGDVAIATGGFKGKGTDAAGKPFEEHERWTDTWMKMPGGKWQCVATQASPVAGG